MRILQLILYLLFMSRIGGGYATEAALERYPGVVEFAYDDEVEEKGFDQEVLVLCEEKLNTLPRVRYTPTEGYGYDSFLEVEQGTVYPLEGTSYLCWNSMHLHIRNVCPDRGCLRGLIVAIEDRTASPSPPDISDYFDFREKRTLGGRDWIISYNYDDEPATDASCSATAQCDEFTVDIRCPYLSLNNTMRTIGADDLANLRAQTELILDTLYKIE